jgi:L-2-amino-thiazoline-4-carboxylic acid hydrolase-like protein
MSNSNNNKSNRRSFLKSTASLCALTCYSGGILTASTNSSAYTENNHKFDKQYRKDLTYRQFYANRYRESINLIKYLETAIGKLRTMEMVKEHTTERWLTIGKNEADNKTDHSLKSYIEKFHPNNYKETLTFNILEDTENAFEIEVTECIWATTLRDMNAADIGYASICYGDYAWATGFNPKIKLVRDKTLMEGHSCCNHRYIMEK